MRQRKRSILAVALVALALLTATAAWARSGSRSTSSPGLLRVAATAAVTTWDPIKSFSTEVLYMANIYEPLLYANQPGAPTAFSPGLAKSWSRSDGGRTWTFHLRKGVTFHDGEALTSSAVKGSIEAAAARGGASFIWAQLKSIDTPDPLTVVIHMKTPSRCRSDRVVGGRRVDRVPVRSRGRGEGHELLRVRQGLRHRPVHAQVVQRRLSRSCSRRTRDYWRGWTAQPVSGTSSSRSRPRRSCNSRC